MNDAKTIEVTIERTIPALPGDGFEAWLNTDGGRFHEKGWNFFLDMSSGHFAIAARAAR